VTILYIAAGLAFFATLSFWGHREMRNLEMHRLWEFRPIINLGVKRTVLPQWRVVKRAQRLGISEFRILVFAVVASILIGALVSFVEESALAGIVTGPVLGVLVVSAWINWQFSSRSNFLRRAMIEEAIPIGAMALSASGSRLDSAFENIIEVSKTPEVKNAFIELDQKWKKLKLEPAEAFFQEALEWDVPEMIRLASITRSTLELRPELGKLWDEYLAAVRSDMEREDRLISRTASARRNAIGFAAILIVIFLGAYPRVQSLLSSTDHILFWGVIASFVGGAYLIWRSKFAVDV